jgi:hypothetical protein
MKYKRAPTLCRSTSQTRLSIQKARTRVAMCTTLLLAALPVVAFAQRAPTPSQASGWKPMYATELTGVSPAERAESIAVGKAIESIFWRIPELADPKGFEVLTQFGGGPPPTTGPQPIEFLWRLWFFEPNRQMTGGAGPTCIEVSVNRQKAGDRAISGDHDASGRLLFIEADVDTRMAGATVVRDGLRWSSDSAVRRSGYVTFSRGSASPWTSVSREQWLRTLIFEAEGKDGDRETSARRTLEKTAYQQWLEGAAERKNNIDAAVTAFAQSQGRAAAEEMRQTLEKTNREVGEQLKAQEAEERERNKQVLSTPTRGDAFRAQLAAMSPAERASGALVDHSGQLRATNDPLGHRVLTPDPAFWRVSRSRAEVHTITVHFDWDGACAHPSTRAALEKAWQNVDWAAIKRFVERP